MVSVAKTQCQAAADAAALAGARTLDGKRGSNLGPATNNAVGAAREQVILAGALRPEDVAVQHGSYHYDPNTSRFYPTYPPVAPDTYNLSRVSVSRHGSTTFAGILGISGFDVAARSVASHRPRDVVLVLDFSGSMNNESDLWNNEGYLGSANNSPNNRDPIFPRFGHYSDVTNARLQTTSSDTRVGKCNITQPALGIPALVDDFYQHSRGSSAQPAFRSVAYDSTMYYSSTNASDRFLMTNKNATTTAARTASEVVKNNNTSTARDADFGKFELDGYASYASGIDSRPNYDSAPFYGFTHGPGYWGKTFFVWPPDPRGGKLTSSTADRAVVRTVLTEADTADSTVTWATSGATFSDSAVEAVVTGWPWSTEAALASHLTKSRATGGLGLSTSSVAYNRILRLHNRPTTPSDWRRRFFLKPGGSAPTFGGPVDDNSLLWDSSGNWRLPSSTTYLINYKEILSWIKEGPSPFPSQLRAGRILYYDRIPDDVPASAYTHSTANSAITDASVRFWKEYIDYVVGVWRDPFGNVQDPGKPSCSYGPDWSWGTIRITARSNVAAGAYMDYRDNPERPRHRLWFGPMTMVQYISDTGLLPGTAHDISMYPAKLGISGALQDIENNHPNDLVSLVLFNRPQFTNDPANTGAFTQAYVGLGRDYAGMIDALWFPPGSATADVRPWAANGRATPRAYGDFTSNTCTSHGFMLAYNQLSSSATLRAQNAGGFGRRGAHRIVVLETDGMANVHSKPSKPFYNGGAINSYYQLLPGDGFTSASYSESELLNVVRRICSLESDAVNGPGYASTRWPVQVHTVAFGAVFEPTASGTERATAVDLMQKISTLGSTVFPSSHTDSQNGFKWCIGTIEERKTKLRSAFSRVMDNGVSPSLIE